MGGFPHGCWNEVHTTVRFLVKYLKTVKKGWVELVACMKCSSSTQLSQQIYYISITKMNLYERLLICSPPAGNDVPFSTVHPLFLPCRIKQHAFRTWSSTILAFHMKRIYQHEISERHVRMYCRYVNRGRMSKEFIPNRALFHRTYACQYPAEDTVRKTSWFSIAVRPVLVWKKMTTIQRLMEVREARRLSFHG